MAGMGKYDTTSPILRGIFVRDRLLCQPLPPPPDDVDFTPPELDPDATTREKFEEHTKNPACQGCHAIINPLGFTLERFDAVGRYRDREGDREIDSASDYVSAAGETMHIANTRDVALHAAQSVHGQLGFIRELFHYTLKQPLPVYDIASIEALRTGFVESDFSIRDLVREIVLLSPRCEVKSSLLDNRRDE